MLTFRRAPGRGSLRSVSMGARPRRSRRRVVVVLAMALVLGVGTVLYLRSGGDDRPPAALTAEQQTSCARLLAFRSSLNDPAVVPSSPAVAPRPESLATLVQSLGSGDELVAVAPSKVRGEVRTLVAAVRKQPADPAAMRTQAFFDARQRLGGFLDDSDNGCQPGGESGDG
jgi:hypothetical protein